MMQTKAEYLAARELEYERKLWANKIAQKLEKKIQKIRAKGFKVIVLGSKVKIT